MELTFERLAQQTDSSRSHIGPSKNKNAVRPSAEKLSVITRALGLPNYLFGAWQIHAGRVCHITAVRPTRYGALEAGRLADSRHRR